MATNPSALSFNGINQYAKLTPNASIKNLSSFTWMAWVKVGALSQSLSQKAYVERGGSILVGGLETNKKIRFACVPSKDRLRFEFAASDTRADTNYDYIYDWDDRWHHVAFVARIGGSSPTYEIYLDSQQRAQGTLVKASGVENISNTAPLGSIYVGNYSLHTTGSESFDGSTYWHGKIDDIICFNSAKSQGDISTYFTSRDSWSVGDSELIFNWRFDENSGVTTTDSDNDGTGGDPLWQGTMYQSGGVTSGLWTIDRPYLGNGALDTAAPSPAPGSISTTSVTSTSFIANWGTTSDNIYVQGYLVEVSGVNDFSSLVAPPFDAGLATSMEISDLDPNTAYWWRVKAYDAANNISTPSTSGSLTTLVSGDLTAPEPPTALTTTGVISFSSFTVQWTASVSTDETGYKIDVATDPFFSNYLTGYRNKDVGNVTSHQVTGAEPLTTYYIRLRAYDAAGNESAESVILSTQTTALPDLISPTTVELEEPTSISARAFTANWEPAADDVGVVSYEVDVSTNIDFLTFLPSALFTWQARNVGNVTSIRVTGLTPNTTYYYRVRAKDSAGNLSTNAVFPMAATTDLSSFEDEGTFVTQNVIATAGYVDVSTPTTHITNVNNKIQVSKVSGVIDNIAYLRLNMTDVVGNIGSAVLHLYQENTTTPLSAIEVRAIASDSVNYDTLTYNTRPTMTGAVLTLTTGVAGWKTIDITDLLASGNTIYTIELRPTAGSTGTLNLFPLYDPVLEENGTNVAGRGAYVEVEHNPATATNLEDLIVDDVSGKRTNLIRNPNFESGATTNWAVKSGSAIAITATDGVNSTQALRTITTTTLGSGVSYGSLTNSPVVVNQPYTLTFYCKASAAVTIHFNYQQYSSSNTLLNTSSNTSFVLTTNMERYTVTFTPTQATAAYVVLNFQNSTAAAVTFYLDHVMLEKSSVSGAYFDGNTSGASWSGTANLSTSLLNAAQFVVESPYTGDSNDNNSVVGYIRTQGDAYWMRPSGLDSTVVIDRTNRRTLATFGPSYGPYNYMKNPSFELDTTGWLPSTGSVTLATTEDYAFNGNSSVAITVPTTVSQGIVSHLVPASAGQNWQARCQFLAPAGWTVELVLQARSLGGTVLGTSPTSAGISSVIGDGTWLELYNTYTLPASTGQVLIIVRRTNSAAGVFYVDSAILGPGNWGISYLDGTMVGGVWEGAAHNSYTSFNIRNNTNYEVMLEYTDSDGIFNNAGMITASIGLAHTTSEVVDIQTTHETLEVDVTVDTMYVTATYSGDDDDPSNSEMVPTISWKRADFDAYQAEPTLIDRVNKVITATITNLKPGTAYTIRLNYNDPDGTFNTIETGNVYTTVVTDTRLETAEGSARITFGGFILSDSTNREMNYGVTRHDAFGFPERRIQIQDLTLEDGAVELSNYWGKRKINIEGFVDADTRSALEDNLRALRRGLAPSQQRLVINTLGSTGRFYYATCESLAVAEIAGENFNHLKWSADFVCADPFAYDNAETILTEFPMFDEDTIAVANEGDLRVAPLFKVRTRNSSRTQVTIGNVITGEFITPSQTIINGDRLVIDTARKEVLKNGVEIDYSGTFPHLNRGSNTLHYSVSIGRVLTEVRWRNHYL